MNKNDEILKIQTLLRIPISDVSFSEKAVELTSGTKRIGGIPYYTISGILHYETGKNVVNWLKWHLVYFDNEDIILHLVKDLLSLENPIITLAPFRGIYVKEHEEGNSVLVTCNYDDSKWTISVE